MSNSHIIFTYNEEAALSAGQGSFITESGAYIITITEATLKHFDSGSKAVEFSGETDDGQKVQYLSVFTTRTDGTENRYGCATVHAMMGCAGIGQATSKMINAQHFVSPEFSGKRVGLVLQKILTSKKDGSDSYKMEIRLPFNATTRQTMKERAEGRQAETVDRLVATLKDRDERRKAGSGSIPGEYQQYARLDDSIPF